jgi:hypothetical protein
MQKSTKLQVPRCLPEKLRRRPQCQDVENDWQFLWRTGQCAKCVCPLAGFSVPLFEKNASMDLSLSLRFLVKIIKANQKNI